MDNNQEQQTQTQEDWQPTEAQIERAMKDYPNLTREEAIMALRDGW